MTIWFLSGPEMTTKGLNSSMSIVFCRTYPSSLMSGTGYPFPA